MPTTTVTASSPFRPAPTRRDVPAAEPEAPTPSFQGAPGQLANMGMAQLRFGLGDRDAIQAELDDMALAIRAFHLKPADQVLRECSAYSARLSELKVLLHRAEGFDRSYARVRTMQVDVYLLETDRQWKTASRLIEIQRQELFLSGAQV